MLRLWSGLSSARVAEVKAFEERGFHGRGEPISQLTKDIVTAILKRFADVLAGLEQKPAEELVFLTNSHVVNQHGAAPGVAPEEAEVVFENMSCSGPPPWLR